MFVVKIQLRYAALSLILINIFIFIIQLALGDSFTNMFLLHSADILSRPWILITSMFLHADLTHILFNMYALLVFGPLIEQRIGSKRFLFIYFLSGIFAAIIGSFFYSDALGASGAIMGILGVTIMLMPDMQVLFFFFIPMSLRTAGVIFALVDIFGIFVPSGVANIAHLAGLAAGLLYGYYLLKKKKEFEERFVDKKPLKKKRHKDAKSDDFVSSISMNDDDIDDYLKNGRL